MAGTSVDGIDASIVITNGEDIKRTCHALTIPYDTATRENIFAAFKNPHADHSALARAIAEDHAKAAETLIAQSGVTPELIGFHGQTIFHDPQQQISRQIGDAQYIADRLGCSVVHECRQNDLKGGGQGAPIAPIYHQALARITQLEYPLAIVNIGGISNITLLAENDILLGFDSGPGNALIDDAIRMKHNLPFDRDGLVAAEGWPDMNIVNTILEGAFFQQKGVKSLDRIGLYQLVRMDLMEDLSFADLMATLTQLTATSIKRGISLNHPSVKNIIIGGGGRLNSCLLAMLKNETNNIVVSSFDDHGIDGCFIEAEMMAYIAMRSYYNLPFTFPQTTGIVMPQSGGVLVEPS